MGVSFACYLLNYLCLTCSYQNFWPMLFPILCVPPWHKYKHIGAKINLSLQQNHDQHSVDQSEVSSLIANGHALQFQKSLAIAIPLENDYGNATHGNKKSKNSIRSSLASSHLSSTPKFHTLSMSDTHRINKQYELYLKK